MAPRKSVTKMKSLKCPAWRAASCRLSVNASSFRVISGISESGSFSQRRMAAMMIVIPALEGEFAICGFRHEKAPTLGDAVRVFVLIDRDIVDFALLKSTGADLVHQSDGVVFLSASTAEMRRIKTFLGMRGIKNL